MKRREFFEKAGLGSAAFASLSTIARGDNSARAASQTGHDHNAALSGPLASAVVAFGQWKTDIPLDRYPNVPPPPPRNNHQLLPQEVTIKAGGGVTFLISGLHQIIVYDDGTEPGQIVIANTVPTTGVPPNVPLIDDPVRRIYRGPDPSALQVGGFALLDRIEAVHFPQPGRYLVICGVLPHFLDGMFGFVKVLP